MSPLFDALEAREPAQREAALMAALPAQLAHARKSSPAYAELLQGFEVEQVTTRAALASLPVVRKHELQERQIAARTSSEVFGGFSTVGKGAAMPRVFSSPAALRSMPPAPSTNPKARRATIGAWPGLSMRRVFGLAS